MPSKRPARPAKEPPARRGAKGKLTHALVEGISRALTETRFQRQVYRTLGISHGAWYGWMQRARRERAEGRKGTVYVEFLEAIERAEESMCDEMEDIVLDVARGVKVLDKTDDGETIYTTPPSDRAALAVLERKRKGWERRNHTSLTGADGGPVEFAMTARERLRKFFPDDGRLDS